MALQQLLNPLADDSAAERCFTEQRRPEDDCCPDCGSLNVQTGRRHPSTPFRYREKVCSIQFFSVSTVTGMHRSKIGYQDWLIASSLEMTNP